MPRPKGAPRGTLGRMTDPRLVFATVHRGSRLSIADRVGEGGARARHGLTKNRLKVPYYVRHLSYLDINECMLIVSHRLLVSLMMSFDACNSVYGCLI